MRLSHLQKFILLNAYLARGQMKRIQLLKYYDKKRGAPKLEDQQGIITKSLERLIERGVLIGYGRRTPEKWFIESVKLTGKGKRESKKLLGQQQVLPLRLRRRSHTAKK